MSASQPARHTMLLLLSLLLISYGVGYVHCSTVPDNSTDMLSLLDFKRAITNNPRQALTSWNTSIPHCQWEGINCSLTHPGRVTGVNLGNLGLSGPISPSLGNLTFLEILNLSINSFTGELPPFNRLHRLELLVMTKNSLQGIISDTLTNCSNLEILDLSNNSLIGEIPQNIGRMSNLFVLDLSINSFIGQVPSSLGKLWNLEYLNLEENKLKAMDIESWGFIDALSNCSNLEVLALGGNQFQGAIPNSIGKLSPNLQTLSLYANELSGQIPINIGNLTGLTKLDLSNNKLDGTIC